MRSLRTCFFAFLLFFSFQANSQNEFITEWNVTATPSNIQFPGIGSGYRIVWEKATDASLTGTINNAVSGQNINFPSTGSYIVKVSNGPGVFIGFNAQTYPNSRHQLQYVRQWGNIQWQSLINAFYQCSMFDVVATDTPNLSNVTSLEGMFVNCYSLKGNNSFALWNTSNIISLVGMFSGASIFNQPLNNWNTSNVTSLAALFYNAYSFNQEIGNWNTSNVTNFANTFTNATSFNQTIGNWNTKSGIYFGEMFYGATAFDQPIGNWDMGNARFIWSMFRNAQSFNQPIGNWNVSKASEFNTMFSGASSFNQPIGNWDMSECIQIFGMFQNARAFNQPIGTWNVSKVRGMPDMFNGASSFNQSLANWDLSGYQSSWGGMTNMFTSSGMNCSNYSATLVGWANSSNTPNGVTLDATGLFYNSSAQAAHNYLVSTKGWTINGDFYFATCGASLPVEFGNISAFSKNNVLFIDWSTLAEKNNSHFEIEASIDGKNFKSIATVKSKAHDGNSDTSIQYSWEGGVNTATTLLGTISLSFLLLGCVKKKRKLIYSMLAVILFSGMIASCSKSGDSLNTDYNGDLFIRIKQVDKDGKFEVSKSIKVIHR